MQADLVDVLERRCALLKGGNQVLQRLLHPRMAQQQHHAKSRRVGIVDGLRKIHMVVRVQQLVAALGVAKYFQCPIGDHLAGVHVGRGARAALDQIDDKLFV